MDKTTYKVLWMVASFKSHLHKKAIINKKLPNIIFKQRRSNISKAIILNKLTYTQPLRKYIKLKTSLLLVLYNI